MEATENKTIGAHFSSVICEGKNSIKWDHEYESARSALYVLLLTLQPDCIWIPYYVCDAVVDAAKKAGVAIRRYKINSKFMPEDDFSIGNNDFILLVNYYGICSFDIKKQLVRFPRKQVVVDCSQAFFDRDFDCLASIYSPRKFLPVPDGGAMIYEGCLPHSLCSNENSIARYQYLLQRIVDEPEISREAYLASEHELETVSHRRMSCFTRILIHSMDLEYIAKKRRENFIALAPLKIFNEFSFDLGESIPLCYPLMTRRANDLRQYLIKNRVLTPKYWPNIHRAGEFESKLITDVVFLPIDHRYDGNDMNRISLLVNKFLGENT